MMDLRKAEIGKVRLRFVTVPGGYLHIVDANAAILNKVLAERYDGQVNVHYDDTNPDWGIRYEQGDNILQDLEALGVKYDKVTYTSDYFPDLMLMAEKLISQGKAYVDEWGRREESRNRSVDENLKLWKEEMVVGTQRGFKCCLVGRRQNPNRNVRDPEYYRCSMIPHHRVGSRYKVYPTSEFACPFVDSKQGITHALLPRDQLPHTNALYNVVLSDMGLGEIEICEFNRLNIENTLYWGPLCDLVKRGFVYGWDDPRFFCTVQGIFRRGLQPDALFRFISQRGAATLTKKNKPNFTTWDQLWSLNRKMIDPVCPRHTAVIVHRRVLFTLTNGPDEPFMRMIPRHKWHEAAGLKETTFAKTIWIDRNDAMSMAVDQEVTLLDWGNAIVKTITQDSEGIITAITGILHLEGSPKTTKLKLTWLPDTSNLVSLLLTDFDDLVQTESQRLSRHLDHVVSYETQGNAVSYFSQRLYCSKHEALAFGDPDMIHLKRGDVVKLERKGYFRCDVPCSTQTNTLVLFAIPDGKARPPTAPRFTM